MFALSVPDGEKKEEVAAEDEQKKLLVNFNLGEVTACVGFILYRRIIVSIQVCGYDIKASQNPRFPNKIIPYCDGKEVKIRENKVRLTERATSIMIVCILINLY